MPKTTPLKINDCAWTVKNAHYDPRDKVFHSALYCGKRKLKGKPYCERHQEKAMKLNEEGE